jgi:hypothetical protein
MRRPCGADVWRGRPRPRPLILPLPLHLLLELSYSSRRSNPSAGLNSNKWDTRPIHTPKVQKNVILSAKSHNLPSVCRRNPTSSKTPHAVVDSEDEIAQRRHFAPTKHHPVPLVIFEIPRRDCHPERSRTKRKAIGPAKSKDPYLTNSAEAVARSCHEEAGAEAHQPALQKATE